MRRPEAREVQESLERKRADPIASSANVSIRMNPENTAEVCVDMGVALINSRSLVASS